jgi:enamine deaminase RidA (YjgF/YER057c/UK114 family)
MINWEDIKTQSIANIDDIVDNAGAVLLDGLTEAKIAGVDLQEQCQVNLDNYKLACSNLGDDQDNDVITKAQTFIDS